MLNIYKASAGSGKTFALTREYFRIVFETPTDYKNILAVTFTNKATEEMKSRIINELHKLASGVPSDYGEYLKQELHFNDEQLKNRANLLMSLLLHDYGRLSVTTIDRFFQRIVKSFAHELGIFAGYNVELDSELVLLKAVDKVMQSVKTDATLRSWIGDLMNTSVDEGKSWSVRSKITTLGEELFKENYMLFDKHILDKFSDKDFLKAYQQFLKDVVRQFETTLTGIGEEAVALSQKNGLQLSDYKGNKIGCAAYLYKLAEGRLDEPTATARKGIDNREAWVTQKSPVKATIENIWPELNRLLKQAIEYYDIRYKNYNSAFHISSNLYQLGILNDLYQEVREYCNEKGLMLLSDTTYILNKLIDGNDTSFLFEKTGNYYKHLMIDEFQDTSTMQWKNFRPLITNSLAEGYETIIVGDVKQSIYRWRNGDWSLLAQGIEREFRTFGVNNITLSSNWRSAREIVSFNNVFFRKAAEELRFIYDAGAGAENPWSESITNAYCDLEQKPEKNKNGYVEIVFGPEKKEADCEVCILQEIVGIVNDIQDRGGQQKDIVILVRGGKEGAMIADYLMEYNKQNSRTIRFISNDSLYVWASPYVQFIVAILKYLIEPYDQINRATILYFYHIFVLQEKEKESDPIFRNPDDDKLFDLLSREFEVDHGKILSYSLYETIELIIQRFTLRMRSEEVPYLIAFQDIVYEYEATNSNSVILFLEWWEKEQGKRVLSTSEETNAVRILTIHKSKGLEFEYVILPFCSWELDSVRPVRRIWCCNREEGFDQLEYAPLNYSQKLADTIFAEDYYDEHLRAYVDNLNLLYVALTRAKTELYLRPFAPKFNKDGSIAMNDMGAFIWKVLESLKGETEGCFVPDEAMNVYWGEKKHYEYLCHENNILALAQYPVYDLGDRVTVKYRYEDYIDVEATEYSAINEGKMLHEIFKSIVSVCDVEEAVQQAYFTGIIPGRRREELCRQIRHYLSDPRVMTWFDTKNRILNEREILFPTGERARPDRVIFDGEVVRIIDYKFGQREESKYLRQVRYYCSILREMGYPNVKGYIWYVKSGKIITV